MTLQTQRYVLVFCIVASARAQLPQHMNETVSGPPASGLELTPEERRLNFFEDVGDVFKDDILPALEKAGKAGVNGLKEWGGEAVKAATHLADAIKNGAVHPLKFYS